MVLIPASSLQLIWTSTAQSGVLRAPSAGCWFSLQHLISNWLTSYLHPGYIIVQRLPSSCGRHKSHSIQPVHGQVYILIFIDQMHLLFTQVHFLFCQLGRGQYVTITKLLTHSHHHQAVLTVQISLTLSHYSSLLAITHGRSSKLHPVSAQIWCK